jgi:hypothetical protein
LSEARHPQFQMGWFMPSHQAQSTAVERMLGVLRSVAIASVLALPAIVAGTMPTAASERTCQTDHPKLKVLEVGVDELGSMPGGSGRFSDGILTVDVENFDGSRLDWRSNHDVREVFLRVGSAGASFNYDPPAQSGSGLSAAGAIDAISFCYRLSDFAPGPSQTPAPTPRPTHKPPAPTPRHTHQPPDTAVAGSLPDDPASGTGASNVAVTLVVVGAAAALIFLATLATFRRRRVPAPVSIWSTEHRI